MQDPNNNKVKRKLNRWSMLIDRRLKTMSLLFLAIIMKIWIISETITVVVNQFPKQKHKIMTKMPALKGIPRLIDFRQMWRNNSVTRVKTISTRPKTILSSKTVILCTSKPNKKIPIYPNSKNTRNIRPQPITTPNSIISIVISLTSNLRHRPILNYQLEGKSQVSMKEECPWFLNNPKLIRIWVNLVKCQIKMSSIKPSTLLVKIFRVSNKQPNNPKM